MKLQKVTIREYKSIGNLELPVDEDFTSLVGANEHGKTNLLLAIKLLDFKTIIKSEDIRVIKNALQNQPSSGSVVFDFILDPSEIEDLQSAIATNRKKTIKAVAPTTDATGAALVDTAVEITTTITMPKTVSLLIGYKDGSINDYQILNFNEEDKTIVLNYLQNKVQNGVFYFDTFNDRLKPRIPKEEVVNKKDDITNGLMKLAGLSGKENVVFQESAVARQLLRNGEAELTKKLKEFWIQGKEDDINVRLNVSTQGTHLLVDIEDLNTYGDVSTRSRGFLFFLSFILKFKEYHGGDLKNFLFLIDEPGLFLHPRGQKDLLSYLERLSGHNQLIYTTHSPFMINRLNNFQVRVVSKDKTQGTQIDLKPYRHNWKSLRASLGIMLADSFYYADNNLVVEGSSDRLYIVTLLKLFHEMGIKRFDLNLLSIIDSGGASEVGSMVRIVSSEERPFVVLLDSDDSANKSKTKILKILGNDLSKVKQVGDFKKDAVTIEDLLPKEFLEQAINSYINELKTDGTISNPNIKVFKFSSEVGRMEELKKFLKSEGEISKLNMARHFDDIISELAPQTFGVTNFKDAEPLVNWVGEVLKIKLDS